MKAGIDFQSSTGQLTRLACNACGEETIHRAGCCIHCKTTHVAYPVKDISRAWVAKNMTIRRNWSAKRK